MKRKKFAKKLWKIAEKIEKLVSKSSLTYEGSSEILKIAQHLKWEAHMYYNQ